MKIVIITRVKEQENTAHLFHKAEEKSLPKAGVGLDNFLLNRLDITQKEKECIINIIESDSFNTWAIEEDSIYDLYSIVSEYLEKKKWSNKDVVSFMDTVKNNDNFRIKFKEKIKPIQDEIEKLHKELSAFKYKEILLSDISKDEWFKEGEIILLPCYQGNKSQINYNPDKERDELIKAIAETFEIKETEENYLYIHDKEWGNANTNPKPESDLPPNTKKYFGKNVRIFTHSSPGSFYFTQVLSKLENLRCVETLEKNRTVFKDPLHGLEDEDITFEKILEKEKTELDNGLSF